MKFVISVLFFSIFVNGCHSGENTMTDPRDGKTYKTVKIGDQIWMAENLNYEAGKDSWCPGNDPSKCAKWGRLYNWETAMEAAPPGWHLPSKTEFETLLRNLGGEGENAYKQIIPGGSSGFNALFGGWRGSTGSFGGMGRFALFWSAAEDDDVNAWDLTVSSGSLEAYFGSSYKTGAISVRLVKD